MNLRTKCWEFFECNEEQCPAYASKDLRCWLISGTHCRDEVHGMFIEKMELCLECEPFKANMDGSSMKRTLQVVHEQFDGLRRAVEERDRELESTSMEMALGLSEVFEALKKLCSGDPSVRISETSDLELMGKLKNMVNLTSESLAEMVDLSHEFAMGLAEHFHVLQRVSKGELDARVSGISQVELMESLKKVTNQTIESVSKEITGRKQAEEALRKSEGLHREAQRVAHIGHWELNPDVGTPVWSDEIFRIFGLEPGQGEPSFTDHETHLHPDDWPSLNDAVTRAGKDGTPFDLMFRIVRPSGEMRWMHALGRVYSNKQGKVVRVFGTAQDITERKRAEEELERYHEELEDLVGERTKELREAQDQLVEKEKFAILGQVAAGLGHELRNPLGAIKNAAYFINMAMEEAEPEVKESLEIIDREVDVSESVVTSLLDLTRPKAPARVKMDINELVRGVLSRRPVSNHVEVVSQLDEGLPLIPVDPYQLDRVFSNLVQNAFQAMCEGGRLVVKSDAPGPEWVAVTFTDTGVGIDKQALGKVFEPLYTTKAKGIGLGLAISRGLVEAHGGRIEVESEQGKGSSFTVQLPTRSLT